LLKDEIKLPVIRSLHFCSAIMTQGELRASVNTTNMAVTRIAHLTTVDISLRYLLLNQLRYLQEQGYDVTAISAPGPHVPALRSAGIRHIAVPMTRRTFTPLADLIAVGRLSAVMRDERFALVHTHSPKGGLVGQLAARRAGVPVVANTIHGYYFTERHSAIRRHLHMTLERLAARHSDVIFFQNDEDLLTARRERLGRPAQWRYLGNGIDLQRFNPRAIDTRRVGALRQELGLPVGTTTVGFVGRLVREKGILDLLRAMRTVSEEFPDARLLVVGQAEPAKADAVVPHRLPALLRAGVIFAGEREEMPELYALMTVLALPSYREGFPRAPMEASAMGIPCVVSDIRGCRQVVDAGRNGMLVPAGDVPGLAAAVLDILRHPDRSRRLGEEGRRIARERFDERAVFTRIADEYARLLESTGSSMSRPSGHSDRQTKTLETRKTW